MKNRDKRKDINKLATENPEEKGTPLNLPRACNDFALRKIASKSKLTAWIDMGGEASLCEWRLGSSDLLAIEILILEVTAAMSIPSNTWRAASTFPFWYSSRPNKALASYKDKMIKHLLAHDQVVTICRKIRIKIKTTNMKSQLVEVLKCHLNSNFPWGAA